MSGALLALDDVACRRGDRLLFTGLSLHLSAGEAMMVTGPNGAGKSSLLRIAAGLLAPFAGAVRRHGAVGLADERAALDEERPLAAALHFWARLDGSSRERVDQALTAMRLGHLAAVPVRLLSTGQRRRAALARLIAGPAPIWLLDEPATGLDAEAAELLSAVLAGHLAGGGVILAASHQPLGLAMAEHAL